MVERTAGLLTAAAVESVKTLLDLAAHGRAESVRLDAAKAILDLGVKVRDNAEALAQTVRLQLEVEI